MKHKIKLNQYYKKMLKLIEEIESDLEARDELY